MSGVTEKISEYIKNKGVPISIIAERTGLAYGAIYPSLCNQPSRRLRADELLSICSFLEVDPMTFYNTCNGKSENKAG